MITVGILTISDSSYRGEREDLSGPLIREIVVEHLGAEVGLEAVVPDEFDVIKGTLVVCADGDLTGFRKSYPLPMSV